VFELTIGMTIGHSRTISKRNLLLIPIAATHKSKNLARDRFHMLAGSESRRDSVRMDEVESRRKSSSFPPLEGVMARAVTPFRLPLAGTDSLERDFF
jgi:hypothetical protein